MDNTTTMGISESVRISGGAIMAAITFISIIAYHIWNDRKAKREAPFEGEKVPSIIILLEILTLPSLALVFGVWVLYLILCASIVWVPLLVIYLILKKYRGI